MSQRPWVNYHHLLYFKTIAQEGGIAKAAKKLRLGQPTLSTQMKQFEEMLGHELFDRSKRQLQLSDAGRMVLGYATEIFRIGDEMVDSLNDHHVAAKIQVQIGVTDTVPRYVAMKLFQKAKENFDCIVSMVGGHPDEMLRELRAHRVDLVVSNYPPAVSESPGFYARSITRMPIAICGSAKFAKLKAGFPESLSGQPFIFPHSQTKLRSDVEHFFKIRDIQIDVVGDVQDTALQKLMCGQGYGLICMARPAVEELVAQKDLSILGVLPDVYEEIWMIAAERRIQNPIAAKIMKEFALKSSF